MNALEAKIHRLIEIDGPISVALFMAICLGDLEHGYYMRQEAFGAKGDFTTAPEVSQLFGEIIGVHLALGLDRFSADQRVKLVELGPGRGTLMADILRTLKQLRPKQFEQLDVEMVETSKRLRELQAKAIGHYKTPVFHDSISTLATDTPLLIIGNEFLDALPIRQFVKVNGQWRERMVTVQNGKLAFAKGAATLAQHELPTGANKAGDGTIFEIAQARTAVVEDLAQRIKAQGGFGLMIDYGHSVSGFGDTFQALKAHKFAPVLEAPGDVDLTSHVDFEALTKVARAADCSTAVMPQGQFLLELGLLERAGALGREKSLEFQLELQSAVQRLASPEAMGDLFKVLCFGPHLPPPFDRGTFG